jgi:hypothetical protein
MLRVKLIPTQCAVTVDAVEEEISAKRVSYLTERTG